MLIDGYVSTLSLGKDDYLFKINEEYLALKAAVVGAYRSFLLPANVDQLHFMGLLEFEIAYKDSDRSGPLASLENSDLKQALVAKLRSLLESLPVKCEIRVELPAFPSLGKYAAQIAPGVTLIAAPHPFDAPESRTNMLLAALRKQDQQDAIRTFVLFEFDGYHGAGLQSLGVQSSLSKLKQIVFIQCAFKHWAKTGARSTLARATLAHGDRLTALELPPEVAAMCGGLVPDDSSLVVSVPGNTILTGGSRPPATDEERVHCISEAMYESARFFRTTGSPDHGSLAAAIEWYQDSLYAGNETFGYIASCIGLEALLGSEDHLDLMSKRLEDRYAFLLGKGRTDRERLRREMQDVLRLRGKLVHAREARLNAEHQTALFKAQHMLRTAIWRELQNMYSAKTVS